MWQNSRCSILFHLLVPGGKWQTEISKPVSFARRCISNFHRRTLAPLLPPLSAVINNWLALGVARAPHAVPPLPDAFDGEGGGIMVCRH